MLRRYPDAIRTFVTILNFIMRMRQYHTRSYQYDQVCMIRSYLSELNCLTDQQNGRPNVCTVCSLPRFSTQPAR